MSSIRLTNTFQVKGKSIKIQLDFDGWINGYFDVSLHYANGTRYNLLKLEQLNSIHTFFEIPILKTGAYYLNMTVRYYWSWNISVWDYY